MSLLVVGSIALDSVETPTAKRDDVLGGSAVYFSYAVSYFTPVSLVGVVGGDWPPSHTELLQNRKVDTAGLQVVDDDKTFRWKGKYLPNMNDRETLEVHLNVFGDFDPNVPDAFQSSKYVFLANGSPKVQMKVLSQVSRPKLTVADTMDLWIREEHDELLELLTKIDGLVLNDSEAKLLTNEENVVVAGRKILKMGPKFVVVKKGEHGAIYLSADHTYVLPAFPTAHVIDPTGAGDSFAGGMMGYLASNGDLSPKSMKTSIAYGILVGSFNVEDFSLDRMQRIEREDIEQRLNEYVAMLEF